MYKQIPLAISPESDSTFDNFFVSLSNQHLINALKQFSLADTDEPFLYLWGNEGSGVTHLLEAVQNSAERLSIQYLPIKELLDYPPAEIMEGMEQLDMICIDNFEAVAGRSDWEESLFHLFNRLREAGKRLLIASHLPPRSLPIQLADLQSRLQWGVVFHIEPLDDVEKQQAIQFRAGKLGMQLSDEVAGYLLQRIGRSTKELFSVVKELDHASLAEQKKLTIPFVKKILNL